MANIVRFGLTVTAFDEESKRFMEEDLASVGLDEHDVYAQPLTVPPFGIPPGWAVAAYRLPYFDAEGNTLEGMYRDKVKYREDITKAMLKEAGCGKYRGPPAAILQARNLTTTEPYLYPHTGPSETVYITEGEKKAAKVANDWRVRAIGIGGKDMWGERIVGGSKVIHTKIVQAIVASGCTEIVVVADPDILEREDVRRSYADFYFKLRGTFQDLEIQLVIPPEAKIDDWLTAMDGLGIPGDLVGVEGIELERSIEQLAQEFELTRKRTLRGFGPLEQSVFNAHQLIHKHSSLRGAWAYNEDHMAIEYNGREYGQDDVIRIQYLMQRHLHLPTIAYHILEAAVYEEAKTHKYSPARDEIMGAGRWDGIDRLEAEYWSLTTGGAAVIRATVLGYVKRILHPGCFWRIMTIFTGPQGVGKTGFADWLVGGVGKVYDIHRGSLAREDKDVTRRMMQPGIMRIDDLDSFGGAEIGRLKAMITSRDATLRVAYGKEDMTFKRRGIMIATTNHKHIVPDDPTGNTRFAVVELSEKLPFDRLLEDRLQILAQARDMVVDGYTEPDDIDFEAMKEFRETSPLRDKLDMFLDDIRDGSIKADSVTIWKTKYNGKDAYAFKAERFWLVVGREPSMYESKSFKQLAIEYGMIHFAKDKKLRLGGAYLKNVYLFF